MKNEIIKILKQYSVPGGKCWKPFLMEEDYEKIAEEISNRLDLIVRLQPKKDWEKDDTIRVKIESGYYSSKKKGRKFVSNVVENIEVTNIVPKFMNDQSMRIIGTEFADKLRMVKQHYDWLSA